MCGIQGALTSRSISDIQNFSGRFFDAFERVKHRGPDGYGFWAASRDPLFLEESHDKIDARHKTAEYFSESAKGSKIFFGHRRLSIIDLSNEASQPMGCQSREGSRPDLWTIFNGEIYNYIELKQELIALGASFHTSSDTEVILRAYERWGTDCFRRFNGMWAIALWDTRDNSLILSRDRMGVKPLYYSVQDGTLFFGSEIKQLIHLRGENDKPPRWNHFRLYEFLSQSHLHHAEDTLYEGIYALNPGHWLKVDAGKHLTQELVRSLQIRFWDFPSEDTAYSASSISFDEAAKELRSLLQSSVALRLRSDVPVGTALSGGLDSSAIVAFVSRLKPLEQKTVSAVFDDPRVDERRFAERVVRDLPVKSVYVKPAADRLLSALPEIVQAHDGPFWSTSMYAQWEVFRTARANGLTVMLDGQGSDEIFAGYEGFLKAFLKSVYRTHGPIKAAWEGAQFVWNHPRYYTWQRVLKKSAPAFDWLSCFTPATQKEIQARIESNRIQGDPLLLGQMGPKYHDPLREALYRSTVCYSLPALLAFEDRNSMIFSVESRTPFLDYRVVEFAFKCPPSFHIRGGMRKALLRSALDGILPDEIRLRKDKIGFATPEASWNHTHFAKIKSDAVLNADPATFNTERLRDALEAPGSWRALSTLFA
jgi:asparagine synthase (glutamine-hydrolysing)